MEHDPDCRLAVILAAKLRENRIELTQRWLDRIVARVAIDPNRVFPTDELLDHVPLLMDRIADFLEDPEDEISANAPVAGKAIELGELRWSQGFDAHEILKECELLGSVLFAFLVRTADDIQEPCPPGELFACAHRLFRAISAIQQVTTMHYLRLSAERVHEREQRLRGFNSMVTHELKNQISSILGAGQLLADPEIASSDTQRARFARMVVQNAQAMQQVLENLLELSRMDGVRQQRNVLLPSVAAEVGRQLRDMAGAHDVQVRIGTLPQVEVNAAAVELCLTNYLSNAIKYSDKQKPERWVEVAARVDQDADGATTRLVSEVRDNGIGVPDGEREGLFTRFFRAQHETVTGAEGTGLGLSIVRETAESMGGSAWADFGTGGGSAFFISLPCRRAEDIAMAEAGAAARPGGTRRQADPPR
jgi:signal transduction histidine kinase